MNEFMLKEWAKKKWKIMYKKKSNKANVCIKWWESGVWRRGFKLMVSVTFERSSPTYEGWESKNDRNHDLFKICAFQDGMKQNENG